MYGARHSDSGQHYAGTGSETVQDRAHRRRLHSNGGHCGRHSRPYSALQSEQITLSTLEIINKIKDLTRLTVLLVMLL